MAQPTEQNSAQQQPHSPEALLAALLATTEHRILPQTRAGMAAGNRVFGAAILDSAHLQPLCTATNEGTVSPILHGEMNCIQKFFTEVYPDAATRPHTGAECIFYATHEPCSLCLSGITWAGFTKIFYLFTYEDSRDGFAMPLDLDILEQVYKVKASRESDSDYQKRPLYNKSNKFFVAVSCAELLEQIADEGDKQKWGTEVQRIKGLYAELSKRYADAEKSAALPL